MATSREIQTLLSPPSTSTSTSHSLAFLNEHFRTLDDLTSDSTLLQDAEIRRNDFHTKLSSSQSEIDALLTRTRHEAREHVANAQELALVRHELEDELSLLSVALSRSMSTGEEPTLLEDIESLHRNLKELESVRGYVQIIAHALELSERAIKQVEVETGKISSHSVSEFKALHVFVERVGEYISSKLEEEVPGSQPELHLSSFLDRIRAKTWRDIRASLSKTFIEVAEKMKWPVSIKDYHHSEYRDTFEDSFSKLLQLQDIGRSFQIDEDTEGVYPLQALVHSVALRFKYHFDGTKQTNRLDKPEWYFSHILDVTHEHREFMETVIQSLLSNSQTSSSSRNAWREFVALLLPLVERKLRKTVPQILPPLRHPALLAHTIYQALSFDATLVEDGFSLEGTSRSKEGQWKGTSEVILGRREWFDAWLEGEKKFADDQLQDLISAPDAWQIADDDTEDNGPAERRTLSVNSARRVKTLIEQVADRYSPLPSQKHRLRFFLSIQLDVLEQYLSRISSSLDAFETLSSALVRAVPGALSSIAMGDSSVNVETQRLTTGIEGAQRLCKALLASKYIQTALQGWGDSMIYLELWNEINSQPAMRSLVQSSHSIPQPTSSWQDQNIFSTLYERYSESASRSEDLVVQHICAEVESQVKGHLNGVSVDVPQDEVSVSQTLLPGITLLSTHLSYLAGTLPRSQVTQLYRRIANRLSEHIMQRQILYRGSVSLQEGLVILAESRLWVDTCIQALPRESASRMEAPWRKLVSAAQLIGADEKTWEQAQSFTSGTLSDEDWVESMEELLGVCDLERDEVRRLLRRREQS